MSLQQHEVLLLFDELLVNSKFHNAFAVFMGAEDSKELLTLWKDLREFRETLELSEGMEHDRRNAVSRAKQLWSSARSIEQLVEYLEDHQPSFLETFDSSLSSPSESLFLPLIEASTHLLRSCHFPKFLCHSIGLNFCSRESDMLMQMYNRTRLNGQSSKSYNSQKREKEKKTRTLLSRFKNTTSDFFSSPNPSAPSGYDNAYDQFSDQPSSPLDRQLSLSGEHVIQHSPSTEPRSSSSSSSLLSSSSSSSDSHEPSSPSKRDSHHSPKSSQSHRGARSPSVFGLSPIPLPPSPQTSVTSSLSLSPRSHVKRPMLSNLRRTATSDDVQAPQTPSNPLDVFATKMMQLPQSYAGMAGAHRGVALGLKEWATKRVLEDETSDILTQCLFSSATTMQHLSNSLKDLSESLETMMSMHPICNNLPVSSSPPPLPQTSSSSSSIKRRGSKEENKKGSNTSSQTDIRLADRRASVASFSSGRHSSSPWKYEDALDERPLPLDHSLLPRSSSPHSPQLSCRIPLPSSPSQTSSTSSNSPVSQSPSSPPLSSPRMMDSQGPIDEQLSPRSEKKAWTKDMSLLLDWLQCQKAFIESGRETLRNSIPDISRFRLHLAAQEIQQGTLTQRLVIPNAEKARVGSMQMRAEGEEGTEPLLSLRKDSSLSGLVRIPLASSEDVIKSGYLLKKGGKRRNWNNRFFLLKERYVYYFDNEKHKELKGTIPLLDCSVGEVNGSKRPNCFAIARAERIWYLCASSLEERADWILAFKRCIEISKSLQSQHIFTPESELPSSSSPSNSSSSSSTLASAVANPSPLPESPSDRVDDLQSSGSASPANKSP